MPKPSAIRRSLLRALLMALVATLGSPPLTAQTNEKREPTLQERLTLGLQARRPSELEFVEAVVDTVERGTLPEKVVNRMFFWARNRTKGSGQRPIIYFQAGLIRVADQMKVTIKRDPVTVEPAESV